MPEIRPSTQVCFDDLDMVASDGVSLVTTDIGFLERWEIDGGSFVDVLDP